MEVGFPRPHEAGNLNSLGAVLGNDVAFNAYREGKLPFPDRTIIAALHYRYVPSDVKTTKSLARLNLSFTGPPTNIQFMVKDSKKYAATGVLGVRYLRRRQTCRRGIHEKLLPLPRRRPKGATLSLLVMYDLMPQKRSRKEF